jgi:hypothetical protein
MKFSALVTLVALALAVSATPTPRGGRGRGGKVTFLISSYHIFF